MSEARPAISVPALDARDDSAAPAPGASPTRPAATPPTAPDASLATPATLLPTSDSEPDASAEWPVSLSATPETASEIDPACVVTAADASRAARLPRQPSEGLPWVSEAAISRPPRRPTFFKKWICCWALASGSVSSQKRWPASVVGISDAASAVDARRGNLPTASSEPATIFTPASILTSITSLGRRSIGAASATVSTAGDMESRIGFADRAWPSGDFSALIPPVMKIAASMGRATLRNSMMDRTHEPRATNAA